MIAAHVTLDNQNSQIVQYGELLSEWTGSRSLNDVNFLELFSFPDYETFEDLLFDVTQESGIHMIRIIPQFTHDKFDRLISTISAGFNISGDRISLKLIPCSNKPVDFKTNSLIPSPLFDAVTEGIIICNSDGNILQANDYARSFFDGELNDLSYTEAIHGTGTFPKNSTLPEALAGNSHKPYFFVSHDNRETHEVRFYPFTDDNGYFQGFTAYIRKAAEHPVQAKPDEQPEVTTVVKRVRETAHDINNIMTV
ncbi:MAG: hypothetical protein GF372_04790, partial [Candidatus Marinimicrobia bacterium]|nr:hypothetical protein [Candidatus Neomarinimicrobiota bacterium]